MLAGGLPAVMVALVLLWRIDVTPKTLITVGLIVVGAWLMGAMVVREQVVRPLQTLSNLLAAVGEEDYTIRAKDASPDDPLGLAYWEINALTQLLQVRRFHSVEAAALLGRVISEIDAALFAFDERGTLRLINRSGERLLGRNDSAVGRAASELGLADLLVGPEQQIVDTVADRSGRWEVRRSTFRQDGKPHHLIVVNDLSAVLREEERQAWQRLVRVLSHEINNSLAPIKSIADSLQSQLTADDVRDDFRTGLGVIGSRSEALRRFMASYARLARLPAPQRRHIALTELITRVVALETRMAVLVDSGPAVTLDADPDQLEQLLINLLSNAVEASTGRPVRVRWATGRQQVSVFVDDEGAGLPDAANLFVPFFTTKPHGSGIGLVLSRQIAEAHGGSLTVQNRVPGPGVTATVRLPWRGGG